MNRLVFLLLILVGVVSGSILVIKETMNGNVIFALTNDFYLYSNLSVDLKDTGEYSIVSYYSLTEEEKEFIKTQYSSYNYVLVKEGLYDVNNKVLCEDDLVYTDKWNCSGTRKPKDEVYRVLLFKISIQTDISSPYDSTFCEKRCYDARADISPFIWKSTEGVLIKTIKIKKGFYIQGTIRPYGNGCFIKGEKLNVCVNEGSLEFRFKHSDGTEYFLKGNLLMKYFNTFTLGVSPNMITLFIRQHGSDKIYFDYIDLDYKPLDNDNPDEFYQFTINLEPLSNDVYEYVELKFQDGKTKVPFCGESVAVCNYNYGAFHVWKEDGKFMFGGITFSAGKDFPDSMVYYNRGGIFEVLHNSGDMFASGKGIGAKRQWKAGEKWGFTQENEKYGITEEYGFSLDPSTMTPYKINLIRDKEDMKPYYYGYESDRRENFLYYPVPYPGFFTDTGIELPDDKDCSVLGGIDYGSYCLYDPVSVKCPEGFTAVLRGSSYRCEKTIDCPEGGTFDPTTNRCTKVPDYDCPEGFTFDSSIKECTRKPECPTGYTLSGNICVSDPVCPDPFVYDSISKVCTAPASSGCPDGYTDMGGVCEAKVICEAGFTYNPETKRCEKPAKFYSYYCEYGDYDRYKNQCVYNREFSMPLRDSRVKCKSYDHAYKECFSDKVPLVEYVELRYQYSSTTCRAADSKDRCSDSTDQVYGTSKVCKYTSRRTKSVRFGITSDKKGIWVNDGCRGRFEVRGCSEGFSYIGWACIEDCPPGMDVDSSFYFKCVSPPQEKYICDKGTLDGDVCYVDPICPSGGSFDSTKGICTAPYSTSTCSTGTYNSELDRCETSPSCTGEGIFDSVSGICKEDPFCSEGVYDSSLVLCRYKASRSCGDVYYYNSIEDICYLHAHTYCSPYMYDSSEKVCYNNDYVVECPLDSVWDSLLKKCKGPKTGNRVVTDDGIFKKAYKLCPDGQVELFKNKGEDYEGICFSYKYDAYCVDETVSGKDQDQFGNNCYLQETITPSICPSDGRYYTLKTPPETSDYICQTTKTPVCSYPYKESMGSCYKTLSPVCKSDSYDTPTREGGSCIYETSVICPDGYSYIGSYKCKNSTGTRIVNGSCPTGYSYNSSTDNCRKVNGSCSYEQIGYSGYSYLSDLDLCGRYVGSACNNDKYMDWGYSSTLDKCVHSEYAGCIEPYETFVDPDTGIHACYSLNLNTPGKPRGSSTEKGITYCEEGDYYWEGRCYSKEGIACDGRYDYTHTRIIVTGKGNSLNEWTGICWEKERDGCGEGSYPGRGEFTTKSHCLKLEEKIDSLFEGTPEEFSQNMCEYITRNKFGTGDCKTSISYKSADSYYKDSATSICPLGGGTCLPIAGELSMCGIDKSCAACTEGDPPKISDNQAYASIKQVKEESGKAYALTWSEYDKLGVENLLTSIKSARLPDSSEVPVIDTLFKDVAGRYWLDSEIASDYFEYTTGSISSYNSLSTGSLKEIIQLKDITGSFSACSDPECTLRDDEVVSAFLAFKGSKGNWYWLGNPFGAKIPFDTSSLKKLKYSYRSGVYTITVPYGESIEQIGDIASALGISSTTGYTGSMTFSLGKLKKKPLVLVFDNPTDAGFLSDCVFTDDYNMLCKADMVECVEGTCPYGSEYKCFSYEGKEYCSKYSDKCRSMADSLNMREVQDTEEGLNDKKANGKVDETGKCLGTVYVFNGYDRRCRPPGSQTLGNNCCEDESIDLTGEIELSKCNDSERYLVKALKTEEGTKGKCHYVGKYCAEKWLGVCVQEKKTYCCFGSVLARIVHEQGRPQIGEVFGTECSSNPEKCWGDPKSPICRGFTPEEFQNLDFSKIDFSEFETSLSGKISSIDTSGIETSFSEFTYKKLDVPDINVSGSTLKTTSLGPTLDFGTITVSSESTTQSFTIKNVGSKDLNFIKISFLGQKENFVVTSNTCSGISYLSPGTSCQIQVKFKPVKTGRIGAYFRFETDDPDEPMFDVHLVGFGE